MPRVHDHSTSLDDPIPAPGEWEVKRYGGVAGWEAYILKRRKQRISKQQKKEIAVRDLGYDGEYTVEEWRAMASSIQSAISLRSLELTQMKNIYQAIVEQANYAEELSLESFKLDVNKPPKLSQGSWKKALGFRPSTRMKTRAEEGFGFLDRLMRQSPRPGTIRQEVSER